MIFCASHIFLIFMFLLFLCFDLKFCQVRYIVYLEIFYMKKCLRGQFSVPLRKEKLNFCSRYKIQLCQPSPSVSPSKFYVFFFSSSFSFLNSSLGPISPGYEYKPFTVTWETYHCSHPLILLRCQLPTVPQLDMGISKPFPSLY